MEEGTLDWLETNPPPEGVDSDYVAPEADDMSTQHETEPDTEQPDATAQGEDSSTPGPVEDETPAPEEQESSEKRRKDAERAYQAEHQAKLELERQLNEFREIQRQQAQGVTDEEIRRKMEEDPIQLVIEQARKIKELQDGVDAKVSEAIATHDWEQREIAFQAEHEDYLDLVAPLQKRFLEGDLREKWVEAGATPEAAYSIAKTENAVELMRKDPEAYEANLIAKIREQLAGDGTPPAKAQKARTLDSVVSTPPSEEPTDDPYAEDPLGDLQFLNYA